MTAMFPGEGVTHEDAKNSLVDPVTTNCLELWYSTVRCQPMFDPAAANAMLSELINLINKGEVSYDCFYLDQVQLAVRYLIQRSLPEFTPLSGATANYYEGTLDPAATRYNDGMTLCVVPHVTNTGACYVNINGLGFIQLMRTDGGSLGAGDLNAGAPALICFHAGLWWLVATGLTKSQLMSDAPNDGQQWARQAVPPGSLPQWTVVVPNPVITDAPYDGQQYGRTNGTWTVVAPNPPLQNVPILLTADLYTWVRPDGNDSTGDGTANDPSKAFRSINGCWAKIGGLYIASPIYSIYIMLGAPGDYDAFQMGGYGGKVRIVGDIANRAAYRINISGAAGGNAQCGFVDGMASLWLEGVCLVISQFSDGSGVNTTGLTMSFSTVGIANCDFEQHVNNSGGSLIWARGNTNFQWHQVNNFRGNGVSIGALFHASNSQIAPASGQASQLNFSNFAVQGSSWHVFDLSFGAMDGTTVAHSGVTGRRYFVTNNSIMSANGQQLPGNQPGSVAGGGRYNP